MSRSAFSLAVLLVALACDALGVAQDAGQPPSLAKRKIVFGGDRRFPPFEFLDAAGQPQGFQIDLIRAIATVLDWEVDVRLDSWDRIREQFLAGEIDIVGMAKQPSRTEWAEFSDPTTAIASEIFVRKGTTEISSLEGLNGKEVILQSGALSEDELKARGIHPSLIKKVETQDDGLRLLASGAHDCLIATQFAARASMQRLGLTNVTTSGPAIFASEYCLCVVRGRTDLSDAINQGLAILKSNGQYNAIYQRWLGDIDRPAISLATVARWAAWIGGPLLGLLLLLLAWSWTLRRQVAEKTRELRAELDERIRMNAERERLQDELLQARKLESIGRLAGGIAHDFNNLLTAVIGLAESATEEVPPDHAARESLDLLQATAQRGALLTRQLLMFARRQVVEPRALDLNDIVRGAEKLLRRLIPESVRFDVHLHPSPLYVFADPVQLEQVLINLCVNARDAMPDGGLLTIETLPLENVDALKARREALPAGDRIVLRVTDTGAGIAPEAREHLFEPFFTTKEAGRGTGLGLATCHGVVSQCGGAILVDSEAGRGSTFSVILPRSGAALADGETAAADDSATLRGDETVLLVEDDDIVRNLTGGVLRAAGYHLLTAANGRSALELAGRYAEPIHLLLADVVMPHVGGPELAQRVRQMHPEARVLLMSGYANAIVDLRAERSFAFVAKPFSSESLLRKVRQALDTAGVASPAQETRAV